jgi:predicted anti-sigma-YlaC factor YlaD
MNIMPSCKEVTAAVASDDLPRRPWHERLAVRLHLLMCRHCRRYVKQLAGIASAVRGLYREKPPSTDSLEKSILESIKKRP